MRSFPKNRLTWPGGNTLEFRYRSEPSEIIDKARSIIEILRNFKNMTVDKIKITVSVKTRTKLNKSGKPAAKSIPVMKKIQIAASGFLSTKLKITVWAEHWFLNLLY